MRNRLHSFMFLVAVAVLLLLPLHFVAAEPQTTQTSVSDQKTASNDSVPKMSFGQNEVWAPRDSAQTWWPYKEKISDITLTAPRIEDMSEDQILIPGVLVLSIRNEAQSTSSLPQELILPQGEQLQRSKGYYLVKIEGTTRGDKEVQALQDAGAVLGEFLPINTYIAMIPSEKVGEVKNLPFVTYLGDYQPAYKISPQIGKQNVPQDELQRKDWRFELTLHYGADVSEVLDDLSQLGIYPEEQDIVINSIDKNFITIFVRASSDAIPLLAKIPGIKTVGEANFVRLLASSTQPNWQPMVLQNNGTYTTSTNGWKLWNIGLKGDASGTAQIVTVMDSGLSMITYGFAQNTTTKGSPGTSHRKVVGYSAYGSSGDTCVCNYNDSNDGGHGTWTSQAAVGGFSNMSPADGSHTPNSYYDTGIAPNAKVLFQDINTGSGTSCAAGVSPPSDLSTSITNAISAGSYIQNHSWGGSNTYDSYASSLDTALNTNRNMVVTVAAGNSGILGTATLGSPGTSKNCITVGGVSPPNPNQLFEDCSWDGTSSCASTDAGSSRGPVTGATSRYKPDICAYMFNNTTLGNESMWAGMNPLSDCRDTASSPSWNWTNSYGIGGTSFAAPQVAGAAALVRDYFMAGYYPTGVKTSANALTPAGTLVKAVILASGEPLGTTAYPSTTCTGCAAIGHRVSNDQGYGRMNLPAALRLGGSDSKYLWVQNDKSITSGQTQNYSYTINSGTTAGLRVMLVWYDTGTGVTLSNNLNLTVNVAGTNYLGNVFGTDGYSTTGGSADLSNPQEGVFLQSIPTSGTVTVSVNGASVSGTQHYSLVVVGNVTDDNSSPTITLDKGYYSCHDTVTATITASTGTPTEGVYHSSTGYDLPVGISGTAPSYTLDSVTTDQLGANDGATVWATFVIGTTTYTSQSSTVDCTPTISVDHVQDLNGGCDGDVFLDTGETLNVYVYLRNNMSYALDMPFYADLVVDPAHPNSNITIVTGTALYPAIGPNESQIPEMPFQVKYTGNTTGPITAYFKIQNIRSYDGMWTYDTSASLGFTLICDANYVAGTTLVSEGFDGTTFPPTGWTNTLISGTYSWSRYTAGTNPTCSPYSGAGMAGYDSYNAQTGSSTLATPAFSLASATKPMLSFYFYNSKTYTNDDTLDILVSTDGGTNWSASLKTIHRTEQDVGWHNYLVDLSSYKGQSSVKVGFLATSGYGLRMFIDSVTIADFIMQDDTQNCSPTPTLALTQLNYDFNDSACNNWQGSSNDYGYIIDPGWSIDAGESGPFTLYIGNTGNENAYNVTATLSCPSCPSGVTICKNTATYGTIPYGTGYAWGPGSDGFEIAIGTSVAAHQFLPFQVALTGDNVNTTLAIPTTGSPFNIQTGTPILKSNASAVSGETYADHFTTAPGTAGATGRVGFTTAWTQANATNATTHSSDGDGYGARLLVRNNSTGYIRKIWGTGTASTVPSNCDIILYFDLWLPGNTNGTFALQYTTNGGTTWSNLWSNANLGASSTTQYYLNMSVYTQLKSLGITTFEGTLWNNPNFGLGIATLGGGSTNTYDYVDNFMLFYYNYQNLATSCTGSCIPPVDKPLIINIEDANPCSMTGIKVYFDGSAGATGYDLLKDGSVLVSGYTSGALATVGDTDTHNFAIRAKNSYGNNDSDPVSFADEAQAVVPTITCSGTCTVGDTLTTESGMTGYQWYLGGSPISGATSYQYLTTQGGTYTVSYQAGACASNMSAGKSVTGGCTNPSAPSIGTITDNDACAQSGISIPFTSGSPATRHDLYVDGALKQSGVTSPVSYNPGDTASHSYVIRAINGTDSCYTDSTSKAFTDTNDTPGAPTITAVNDVDACAQSGIQVVYTSGTGATSHDLYKDGTKVVTGYTSGTTYNPADTTSHNYIVKAVKGTCTTDSNSMAGTDVNDGVGAPTITAVNDVDACAQSGIQVVYTAGSGATSHDLYRDGTKVVTGYTSGATYNPSDTTSHSYIVKAVKGTCTTDSNTMAGTDVNDGVGAPTITAVNDVDACAQSGIQVVYTAGSGATSHDLYRDGTKVVTGYTSGTTYNPADTTSHSYVVKAVKGTCTTDSNSMAGTDVNGTPSQPAITSIVDIDPNNLTGIQVYYTSGTPATQHDLYKDGTLAVSSYVSGTTYQPGDSSTHSYVVKAINGTCTTDSVPVNGTDAYSATPPPEPTPITPSTDKSAISWSPSAGATGYRVYRGTKDKLAALCNATEDFCTAQDSPSTSYSLTGDIPDDTYKCFYYLVTAYNAGGESSAGTGYCSGTWQNRTVNTAGTCP